MALDLKQLSRRLVEEMEKGNMAFFDEICDPDYRSFDPVLGEADLRRTKEYCGVFGNAFPDAKCTVVGMYVDGDTVVNHWRVTATHRGEYLGVEPTGNRCVFEGISVQKYRKGRLLEERTQWDVYGLLRQLGTATLPKVDVAALRPPPETRPHA